MSFIAQYWLCNSLNMCLLSILEKRTEQIVLDGAELAKGASSIDSS